MLFYVCWLLNAVSFMSVGYLMLSVSCLPAFISLSVLYTSTYAIKFIDSKLSQSKKKCGIRHRNTKYTELLYYKTFNNFTQNIQTN